MDPFIKISTLNDYVFCPKSIYFHDLYGKYSRKVFQWTDQIEWEFSHESIDKKKYSTSKKILQGLAIYSSKYNIWWKIDLYHIEKKSLMERKTFVEKIYYGYVLQVYAQYFCMIEMGYQIDKIKIYSIQDNKVYEIPIPGEKETKDFEIFLDTYRWYHPDSRFFNQNPKKCEKCIYNELCDFYKQ